MKFKISKSSLNEFVREVKRLGIRHKPFTAWAPQGYYEIELYPNPNNLFLKLKFLDN